MNWQAVFSEASLLRFGVDAVVITVAAFVVKRGVTNQIVLNYKAAAESAAAVALAAQGLADVNAATCLSLREQIAEHSKQILVVHQELGGLKKENEFLRNRNVELQKEICELRDEIAAAHEENNQLRARLSTLENGAPKPRRKVGGSN